MIHYSDALLGAFAAIAPAAAAALQALDDDDIETYRREMAPTRAAVPAHLCYADVLLQDRDRLPGLAERSPGRLRHGRWPAVGSVHPSSGARVRAGQRGTVAHRPGTGGVTASAICWRQPASLDDGVGGWTGSRSTSGPPPPGRCPRRCRVASMPGSARSESGASSSRRSALEEGCRLVAESGLRVSSLCRGGFFTTADPAEARGRGGAEPGGARGGGGARRGDPGARPRRSAAGRPRSRGCPGPCRRGHRAAGAVRHEHSA